MRVTPGMTTSRYQKNLANATAQRDYYFNRANTLRNFESPAENPTKAARLYRTRTSSARNADYLENAQDMKDRMNTADSAVYSVVNILHNAHDQIEAGMNGTNEKFDRKTYAESLRKEAMPSIISSLNASDGDQYLFGGIKYKEPPFTLVDGELNYRGVNVNTGKTNAFAEISNTHVDFGKANTASLIAGGYKAQIEKGAGNSITVGTDNVIHITMAEGATVDDLRQLMKNVGTNADIVDNNGVPTGAKSTIDFSKGDVSGSPGDIITFSRKTAGVVQPTAIADSVNLADLPKEAYFVDVGMGLDFDANGKINPQSAFDASLPGIGVIGYGKETNGMPKNAYTLLDEIATILEDDTLDQDALAEKLSPYLDQVATVREGVLKSETDIGSKVSFLESTISRLGETQDTLDTKATELEFVDSGMAAIESTQAGFLYQSVLRLGSNILQTSLLDFMK